MATPFLSNWNLDPSIVGGTLVLALAYGYVLALDSRCAVNAPMQLSADPTDGRRNAKFPIYLQRRALCFWAGEIVLLLALASPLDNLSDHRSLFAHMIQHLLLLLVVPTLFLFATPAWLFESFCRSGIPGQLIRLIASPLFALVISILTLWAWHAPALYEAALHNEAIHAGEHLTFLATALLFWWPVLRPSTHPAPMPEILQIVYLFASAVSSTILGALITFSATILYPTYAHSTGWLGLSPLADQQLAGLLMWTGAGLWGLTVAAIIFFRWFDRPILDDEPARPLEHLGVTT